MPGSGSRFELVVLVASLGGLDALSTVLGTLPPAFPVPVAVVQHGRPSEPDRLSDLLARRTPLPVRSARPGASAREPGVTVVTPGWNATLGPALDYRLTPSDGVHGGDGLLTSAATALGPATIGVILTGMQQDGAVGVRAVKRHGGRVLVQDPVSARAGGMPSAAIATGCVDFVLPLERIGAALVAFTMAPGGADLFAVPLAPWVRLPA